MTLLLHKEIDNLKKRLLHLGAVVEEALRKAVRAFVTRDAALARQVIHGDEQIDELEVEFEEEGLKIIALHQPVAVDLRFIVSVMRINADLERIGDLAVNLAERAAFLADVPGFRIPVDLPPMADEAQEMLKASLDALVNSDPDLARRIIERDDVVDNVNKAMYEVIYDLVRKDPDQVEPLLHVLSAARYLERVADHATNIAEDVIYMAEGTIVRHLPEDFRKESESPGA
jgi:phosphate transport system protein